MKTTLQRCKELSKQLAELRQTDEVIGLYHDSVQLYSLDKFAAMCLEIDQIPTVSILPDSTHMTATDEDGYQIKYVKNHS